MRKATALLLLLTYATSAAPAYVASSAVTPAAGSASYSQHHFANSGNASAQAPFLRGLLLLHSFEYGQARTAFQDAERLDPGFAMAYWGEALTYNHALWNEQDLSAARAALARLAPDSVARAQLAGTARERDYLAAVELLFGEGGKTARDAAYCDALQALAHRYPDDLDARAFYSLALLSLSGGHRNVPNYMRAAAEAEAVLQIDPRHPGALHYAIHAYDDPVHAPLGLRAARLYAQVAPDAEHALHMPSHIYFALGQWDEAIAANAHSVHASHRQGESGYHALLWLEYAYLQRQLYADAAGLLRALERDAANPEARESRLRLAFARATWLIDAADQTDPSAAIAVDNSGVGSIGYFAVQDFARGLTAAELGDQGAAHLALAQLRARLAAATPPPTAVAVNWYDQSSAEELMEARALIDALEGVLSFKAGEHGRGIEQVRRALRNTAGLEFEYGPPWSAKPLEELLGELLLADGRAAEAADTFRRTLLTYPNRRRSLQDLATATALLPTGTPAATVSRDALVGAWQLVTIEVDGPNGPRADPFYGPTSTGLLVYDASGTMSVQIGSAPRAARAVPATRASGQPTAAALRSRAELLDHYYAYFGRWDFDSRHATVTHYVDTALYASEEGASYSQQVELQGSKLIFTRATGSGNTREVQRKIWERLP